MLHESRGRKSERNIWRTQKQKLESNTQKVKEADSLDNMGVTIRTELVVNYQLGQNITVKDYKRNNVTHQTDNTITIYNETTKEVYIDKQERIN